MIRLRCIPGSPRVGVFLLVVSLLVWAVPCHSQGGGSAPSSSPTNFQFAKPNELTITVDLIGFVQRPGRYEISGTVKLPNLIALAGGPTSDGTMKGVRVRRFQEAGGQIVARTVSLDLEDYSDISSADLVLENGDIIEVGRTSWSVVRDAFTVITSAAVITTAVATVILATK